MAGRSRLPRHQDLHGFHDAQHPQSRHAHAPIPHHHPEEEIEIRRDDIRRLRTDNQFQVEENIALRREIAAAGEEIHILSQTINKVRADKEAQARELIEKVLKLEKELHSLEPARAELLQLKSEAQKLDARRKELSGDAQSIAKKLKHLQAESQQLPSLKMEIDSLHQELVRCRGVYEYEKKANEDQLEHWQALEKNLTSMSREVEKLRAEQKSIESRPRPGSGPGAYGDGYSGEKGNFGSGVRLPYEHRSYPPRY